MKRVLLFSALCFFLCVVSSCFHDWVEPANELNIGEWKWTYSIGGISVDSVVPTDKVVVTLNLNNDSTYTFYLNNQVQSGGSYSIQTTADNKSILHFSQAVAVNRLYMQQEQLIIKMDSSQLHLSDYNISDGLDHYFEKVK